MNLAKIKARFPKYKDMSETAFFNHMHKTYYSDMSRSAMYKKLSEVVEKIEAKEKKTTPPKKIEETVQTVDKSIDELKMLVYTLVGQKPQGSTKTMELQVDNKLHEKLDLLSNKVEELTEIEKPKPAPATPSKWEFTILRDKRGLMEKVVANSVK
ncbi:hypothetical protein [Candidatus Magnetobacterium casense]|uniref:Uncharacterized protein n=1 Tax=Candidatus Magnetobacterium casense TaxID=1455061 RepID=A0ABS6RUY0_9BACT|nr:hypothetical protein [Candidatus Magnetobacterium casensis]MBV6340441.1 hypothetical protein [Candidatus Magnetobacterium casensis]